MEWEEKETGKGGILFKEITWRWADGSRIEGEKCGHIIITDTGSSTGVERASIAVLLVFGMVRY